MDRRRLLSRLAQGAGLVIAGVTGLPALLAALAPAYRRTQDPWRPVGPLDRFPAGQVREAVVVAPTGDWPRAFRKEGVYVWRPSDDEVVVFSRSCTDLSCPVNYDPGSACYFCPCHGGIFTRDGTPIAGPPPRPLFRYATRIRGGVVELDVNSVPPMA